MSEARWRLPDPDATTSAAEAIGAVLDPGQVLGLTGPLGAGKTHMVHGLVRGALSRRGDASRPRVCSPSYTIINTYETPSLRIHHMDLYRLADVDDLETTGYWDVLYDEGAIAFVEWFDQIPGARPDDLPCLVLALALVDGDEQVAPRVLTVRPCNDEEGTEALFARVSAVLDDIVARDPQ